MSDKENKEIGVMMRRGSIGGVTVDKSWMYNNPDLRYPEGHELMNEKELEQALRVDFYEQPKRQAQRKTRKRKQ